MRFIPVRTTLIGALCLAAGCAHVSDSVRLAAPAASLSALSDPDLDALDRAFQQMRPAAKAAFLKRMASHDPALKKRWDAYQAAKQHAFADANPPVAPLSPGAEQAMRQALVSTYQGVVVKSNMKAPVDCDGAGPAYGDKYTDFETSVTVDGKPLNADLVLYHVRPVGHPELDGALAIHFLGARMVPSVYGDAGPAWGECCHLLAQQLGVQSSPINGGATSGHDMYLLPKLGAAFMATGQQPTPANLEAFCQAQGVPGFNAAPGIPFPRPGAGGDAGKQGWGN